MFRADSSRPAGSQEHAVLRTYVSRSVVLISLIPSLVAVVGACGSGDIALGSQSSRQTVGPSCTSAGGTCLATGGSPCASRAPASAQDCNPQLLPSGSFCCLDEGDAGANGNSVADSGGACSWPADLNSTDLSTAQCRVAHALLSCEGSNGTSASCISNDPTQCPGPNPQPGVSFTCTNQCNAGEYAATCGGVGPQSGPSAQPPTDCRNMGVNPGGISYYCCPCGD